MPSPIPESCSPSVDRAQQYKGEQRGSTKDGNPQNNEEVANLAGTGTSASGGLDIWSGLNLDQLRLEWAGTDPSSKEYTISAYLPQGLNPRDLSISLDSGTRMLSLQCRTQQHREQTDEQGTLFMSQDSASYTQRAFTLPEDVDLAGIQAISNNTGGFQLHLPKKANQGQQQAPQQGGVKPITIQ